MKERKYFLFVQNQSIANFRHFKTNVGVKVFLPSYITTDMFNHLIKGTGLSCGYIDAVLFKAASNGLIEKKKAKK